MVYVTGDMHGDYSRFDSPAVKQLKKGDTLIICGDFGFVWDNSKIEQKILKKLAGKKFNICFIDGTHENAASIVEMAKTNNSNVIEDNILYLDGGLPFKFLKKVSPEEMAKVKNWVDEIKASLA